MDQPLNGYEIVCQHCKGAGWVDHDRETYQCEHCKTAGFVLTKEGELLMGFLRRHSRVETKLSFAGA